MILPRELVIRLGTQQLSGIRDGSLMSRTWDEASHPQHIDLALRLPVVIAEKSIDQHFPHSHL